MSVKKNLIDQKEYLKKYLSGDKKKKKKDKKHKKHESRLKIIDDNLFAHEVNDIDEELLLTGEDAPQIVGDVIEIEPDKTVAPKWRNIAVKEEPVDENEESKYKPDPADMWGVKKENTKIKDEFSPRKRKIKKEPADSQTDGNGTREVDSDLSPPRHRQRNNSDSDLSLPRRAKSDDSDLSLPRRRRRRSPSKEKLESRRRRRDKSDDSDLSLPRRKRKGSADSDLSLPRRRRSEKNSRDDVNSSLSRKERRRSGSADSDMSLPRRHRSEKNSREDVEASLSKRGRRKAGSDDSDMSLPRRRRSEKNSRDDVDSSQSRRGRRRSGSPDSDLSLPRRRRQDRNDHSPRGSRNRRKSEDSDISLPRRRRESSVSRGSRERSSKRRPVQNPEFINSDNDSDLDLRRNRRSRDVSTTRVKVKREILSPEICRSDEETTTINNPHVHIKEEKLTPPRKKQSRWNKTDDNPKRSPTKNPFKRKSSSPTATHRNHKPSPLRNRNERKSSSPPPTHKGKIGKTLDGKKAGLQDAQALKLENEKRRREEERLFEEMSKDVSGRDAEIAVRKSGRKGRRGREAEEEDPEERMRHEQREKEKKEVYDRWGKGVKQVEDYRQRLEEDAYEASKPLARYSNDEDLDRYLREQEHAEDPMLQYMREKKRKKAKEDNVPVIPKYEGSFPENRYGIRPGYRWDGVDRSNGYEKRWFEVRNERRAREEEAYKYSVEDM